MKSGTPVSISVVADEGDALRRLIDELTREGYHCSIAVRSRETGGYPGDLVLLDADSNAGINALSGTAIEDLSTPVIILGELETLHHLDSHLRGRAFVVKPCNTAELVLRIEHALNNYSYTDPTGPVREDKLVIDAARCEVTFAGHPVTLTFREYELLRFLAENAGRVFTRNALLDRVWGEDYFGGDRTVDVHIRRLRSKLEGYGHSFIETVRNIGYRFNPDA